MTLERWRPGWGIARWWPMREIEEWERQLEEFFGRPLWRVPAEERAWSR
jgi:hypothetical protein